MNSRHGRPRLAHRLQLSRPLILSSLSLLVLLGPACQYAATEQAQEHFEHLASKLQVFNTGDFLFDRIDSSVQSDDDSKTLSELMTTNYPETALIELLKHDSPKVRTLALACLFAKENPTVLPDLVKMVDDQAATFPTPTQITSAFHADLEPIPTEPQTVGQVAEQMVGVYLGAAGYPYGVKGSGDCPGFDHYWATHRAREYNASWFDVQMARATQGISPIPSGRENKFQALRQRIDRLPAPDRLWYLLLVGTRPSGDQVVSADELIDIAKTLGPDQLLLLLARRVPNGDPDLFQAEKPQGCGGYDWSGAGMVDFILAHAEELLREQDAEFLLNPSFLRDEFPPDWGAPPHRVIAAAALHPDLAETILKEAMSRWGGQEQDRPWDNGWDRARLAAALYHRVGESQTGFVLNWFYTEPLRSGEGTTAHQVFIEEIGQGAEKETKKLLAHLIQDRRFESLNVEAISPLIVTVNKWLPTPLVEDPYSFISERIPDEKAALKEFKKLLRESIPSWGVPSERSYP